MRDAAVGFQCPDCVKEGAKSTRQGRGAYGGKRSLAPGEATSVLIGINVVVYVLITATGGYTSNLLRQLELLPQTSLDGSTGHVVAAVSGGAWWQLVTVMFTHVQLLHLIVNMVSLYFVGQAVEQILGKARFLAVYLGSGLVASAAIMWFSAPNSATVGASGAIFGLLGSFLVLAVKLGGDVRQVVFWIVLNLVFTFSYAGISWQGHVGGLVGGLALTAVIAYAPRERRELIQWTGVAVIVVGALVAAVIRGISL